MSESTEKQSIEAAKAAGPEVAKAVTDHVASEKTPAKAEPVKEAEKAADKPPVSPTEAVPKAVVSRLSLYLRELQHLVRGGGETTSSTQLGKMLGVTDAQVRKDLAYFGQFGYPGIGYRCHELIDAIKKILGTHRDWPVALVGIGNLGRALMRYRGFANQGFRVVAAFDIDEAVIGTSVQGIPVFAMEDISRVVNEFGIKLAILAPLHPRHPAIRPCEP